MADLLGGIKRFGGNLLDFVNAYGSQEFAPISEPDPLYANEPGVQRARKAYDQNFRAARAAAVRNGAGWASMNNVAGSAAEAQYGDDLGHAYKQAEAIRAARDARRRQEMIDRYVQRASGLNPDQREFLQAADTNTSEKILGDVLFPNSGRDSVASAGTIVATKRAPDGEIIAIVQTGDPTNPVKGIKTGMYEDQSTSEMRTNYGYANDPRLAAGAEIGAGAGAFGKERGTADAKARASLPAIITQTRTSKAQLTRLLDEVSKADTGKLDQYAAVYDSRLQALESELNDVALRNIAALQNEGVRLTPITEHELAILFSTSARIGNNPEANRQIIQRKLQALEAIEAELQKQVDWLRGGNSILDYGFEMLPPAPTATGGGRGGPRRAGGRETESGDIVPPPPPGAVIVNPPGSR